MRGGGTGGATKYLREEEDAESLFCSKSIPEIRNVEASAKKDIDNKREDLRQLVGRSYRDLIHSADSILRMKSTSESIANNLQRIDSAIRSLADAAADAATTPKPNPSQISSRERRTKLYGIGCRIKYLVDTPENIWGFLDESMFLEASGRYLRARKVYGLLTHQQNHNSPSSSSSSKEFLSNFPLLRQHYQLVESSRSQISQKSRERLLVVDSARGGGSTSAYAAADALAAIAIVDDMGPEQMFDLFLDSRRTQVSMILLHSQALLPGGGGSGSDSDSSSSAVSRVFCRVVALIQLTLAQVGELFLQVLNDLPLFYKTVLSAPPGSQLFGGIPDPDDEMRTWKQHWERLEGVMGMLQGEFIAKRCLSWLELLSRDLSSAVLTNGLQLVEVFSSGEALASAEKEVRAQLDSRDVLKGSLEWLNSVFGSETTESPWQRVCELVLKEPKNLWNDLFEQAFVQRMKRIISNGFEDLSRTVKVRDLIRGGDITESTPRSGSIWFVDRANKRSSLSAVKAADEETDFKACFDAYFGPEGSLMRDTIDSCCTKMLGDLLCFVELQKATPRLKELAPYLQEKCYDAVHKIIKELEEELEQLASHLDLKEKQEHANKKIDYEAIENEEFIVVGKALFIGRLLFALRNHSSLIPLILGSPRHWVGQNKAPNSVSGSFVSRQSRIGLDYSFLDSPRKQVSPSIFSTLGLEENANPKLDEISKSMRDLCIRAYSLWALWLSRKLSMFLSKNLNGDDSLSTTTALKGWEETVVKQDESQENSAEMRISLPSMPSLYVTEFLFHACHEIHKVGGHVLDKVILHNFTHKLLEQVLSIYSTLYSDIDTQKIHVSEKGILQILFDLRFIADVLSGGNELSLNDLTNAKEKERGKRFGQTAHRLRLGLTQLANAQEDLVVKLIEKFSERLDPVDWATYESYLWENRKQAYQRHAVLFGFLVQLNRLHTNTVQKLPTSAESNIVRCATVPRFKYLPISTPVLSTRGMSSTNLTSSDDITSRSPWKAYTNGDQSPRLEYGGSSSVGSATPLFKFFMTQMGSKFGESTLKLGSMLTDGQVGRLKDKSSAAMSTFGDMLPVQAAGFLSSFAVSTSRTEF